MKTTLTMECEISTRDADGLIETQRLDYNLGEGEVTFTDPGNAGLTLDQVLTRASAIRVPGRMGWTWEAPTRENFEKVMRHHMTKTHRFKDGRAVPLHRD